MPYKVYKKYYEYNGTIGIMSNEVNPDSEWKSMMLRASTEGDLEDLERAIQLSRDIPYEKKRVRLNLCLKFAITSGHYNIVNKLIENGADSYKTESQFLLSALRSDQENIASLLLENGASFEDMGNEIILAASELHFNDALKQIIKRDPELLKPYRYGFNTPLGNVLGHCDLDMAQYMIHRGADLSLESGVDLAFSLRKDDISVVDFLIDNGYDLSEVKAGIFNSCARKNLIKILDHIFELYSESITQSDMINAFFESVTENYTQIMKSFINNGVNINTSNRFGVSPLFGAVHSNAKDALLLLIDNNVEFGDIDNCLKIASEAVKKRYPEILMVILEHVDNKKIDYETLFFLADRNDKELIQCLIEYYSNSLSELDVGKRTEYLIGAVDDPRYDSIIKRAVLRTESISYNELPLNNDDLGL